MASAIAADSLVGDPIISTYFQVEVSGKLSGYFTEVSGLGSESDVAEHKIIAKGAKGDVARKIPGRLKWGDITLKRGITKNMDMWAWRDEVVNGNVAGARAAGSVYLLAETGDIIAQWDFVKAWPSKISGPTANTGNSEIGVEELTLVHEGIKRIK